MARRYSKKRQSIIECLQATDAHPDAEWVYNRLKTVYPDLSLGTVYRNLKELKRTGDILSVGVVQEKEHFDARTDPHPHAVCRSCGKIVDLKRLDLPPELLIRASEETGFLISYSQLRFVGVCADCRGKERA